MLKKTFAHVLNSSEIIYDKVKNNEDVVYCEPEIIGKRTRYYVGKQYPGIYFTPQEARCMYYFMGKLTNQRVSTLMNLRYTTVIYYSLNMQCKIPSRSKKELVAKVKETDFIRYLQYLRKVC